MQKRDAAYLIDTLSEKEIKEVKKDIAHRLTKKRKDSLLSLLNKYDKVLKKNSDISIITVGVDNKVKRDLKKEILISLVRLYTNIDKPIEDSFHLKILEILFDRKLYDEMLFRLEEYKDLAIKREQYLYLTKIIDWEMQWLKKNSTKKDYQALQILIEEQEHYLNLYQKVIRCQNLYQQILLILEQDFKLNKIENKQLFERLCAHPILNQEELTKHIQRKETTIPFWIYRIKSMYYRTKGEARSAYECAKKLVLLFEEDEKAKENFQKLYIAALLSLSKSCLDKHQKEVTEIIKKLYELVSKSKDASIQNLIRSSLYDIEVLNAIKTSQFLDIDLRADEMHKEWKTIAKDESKGKLLYYTYYYCLLYWLKKSDTTKIENCENEQSRFDKWFLTALNIGYAHKGRNYYFATRILDLCTQYDEGQFLHLESSIDAYRKTLEYNKLLNDFEKTMIQTLKNLHKEATSINRNVSKKMIVLKKLETEIDGFLACKQFVRPTNFYQVCVWCKGHLLDKSYLEIHRNFRDYFPNYG